MADPVVIPAPDDRKIWPILSELSACLCGMLTETGFTPCFCGVLYSQTQTPPVDLDGCDACGAGYVRLNTGFPSTVEFPQPDQQATCRSVLAFDVTVGIVRCAPAGDNYGNPPSSDELVDFARTIFSDMALIHRAIACCLVDAKFEDIEYVLGTYTQLPAEGGVGGGEWQLTIREVF